MQAPRIYKPALLAPAASTALAPDVVVGLALVPVELPPVGAVVIVPVPVLELEDLDVELADAVTEDSFSPPEVIRTTDAEGRSVPVKVAVSVEEDESPPNPCVPAQTASVSLLPELESLQSTASGLKRAQIRWVLDLVKSMFGELHTWSRQRRRISRSMGLGSGLCRLRTRNICPDRRSTRWMILSPFPMSVFETSTPRSVVVASRPGLCYCCCCVPDRQSCRRPHRHSAKLSQSC